MQIALAARIFNYVRKVNMVVWSYPTQIHALANK